MHTVEGLDAWRGGWPYFAILAGVGLDALTISFAARLRWLRSSHAVTTAIVGDISRG